MALASLPPELTLDIADLLDPESSLNFALTCKQHACLLRSMLREHGQMFSKWRLVDTQNNPTVLWKTLKEILMDPQRGWYVRELSLPYIGEFATESRMGDVAGPSDDDMLKFIDAGQKLRKLYSGSGPEPVRRNSNHMSSVPESEDLASDIENRLRLGSEDAIVVILLHYLPFLKTIAFSTERMGEFFEATMHRIASEYKKPVWISGLPLQHLKTVAIIQNTIDPGAGSNWGFRFLSIPSLRTFVARGMGGLPSVSVRDCYIREDTPPYSNVTELFLAQCHFGVKGLDSILRTIKSLEKLTYEASYPMEFYELFDAKGILQSITARAGHSMQELTLAQEGMDYDVSRESACIAQLICISDG